MTTVAQQILVLDIETATAVAIYEQLPLRMRALWDHKAQLLTGDPAGDAAGLFEKRGSIYAEFGKVIVIGLGLLVMPQGEPPTLRVKALYGDDEAQLLRDFSQVLAQLAPHNWQLCAHNGKEFDFPYLCRRLLVNGLPLPHLLDVAGKKPWEVPFIDTMELWKFGDRKSYTSLELLAALFAIPSSKQDMQGSEVNRAYHQENRLTDIANYCLKDVVVTAQLYRKLKGEPLLPTTAIDIQEPA